jgi:hypothetical protein
MGFKIIQKIPIILFYLHLKKKKIGARPRVGIQLADVKGYPDHVTQLIDTSWCSPKKASKLLNYQIIKKEK